MGTYLSPGVYIEEQQGLQPIEGVSTSITGMVGMTQMGPLDINPPVLVTSFPEYQRTFGGYFDPTVANPALVGTGTLGDTYNLLPHAVAGFFNNGGQLLYIKRVGSSATPPASGNASSNLENAQPTPTTFRTRLTRTAFPGQTTLYLSSLRGIQNGTTLTLNQVKYSTSSPFISITATSGTLTVTSYNAQQNSVTLTAPIPAGSVANYNWQNTTVALTSSAAFPTPAPPVSTGGFALQAATPGVWGNSIALQITPSSRTQTQAAGIGSVSPGTNNLIQLKSGANFYDGAIVEFDLESTKFYAKVLNVAGSTIQLTSNLSSAQATAITSNLGASTPIPVTIRTCEFDIADSYGNVNESFRGLTLDNTTPYYYATTIVNGSSLLTVPLSGGSLPYDNVTTDPSTMPVAPDGMNVLVTGGLDGAYPSPYDYVGQDLGPGTRTGIAALTDAAEISIIAAPGITDQTTQMALITQCETLMYRFAILDPAPNGTGGTPSLNDIQSQRNLYDTHYAAIYYPRIIVSDPLTGNPLTVSPSGHMAGIYAQTDATRGVWKAPANVVINGILDLEIKLSKGDQDILNPEPNNICALRDFTAQGRGLRVYGARCITSDTEWMYINVRRLFIFVEASLDQGTQWAVFEPNDQRLWNQLIQSVSSFLTSIWQQGGLMGSTADQAFFVKCGYDTMSTDDMENGRLIMVVGVAPVFPAEFVIIQIGQWAGGSSVQEL